MNEQNYASRGASQRLAEAGIVLETEAWWFYDDPCGAIDDPARGCYGEWVLQTKARGYLPEKCIPAPSMAEVWRELPERVGGLDRYEFLRLNKDEEDTTCGYGQYAETGRSTNPTDALIDLLIWVRATAADAIKEGVL